MGSNTRIFARIIGLGALGLLAIVALFGGSLQALAGVPATLPSSASALPADPTGKIDKQVLSDTADGHSASFVIYLTQQANLTQAYSIKNQDARGWYVYNTLRDTAASSQAPIRASLATAGVSFQSYWAANMIVAAGDRSLVESLAARSDVKSIDSNDPTRWIDDPTPPVNAPSADSPSSDTPNTPDTVEWGVQNVNAPALWALGYTGQGIVVASQDTGVRWTHNALKPQYRGWNGTTADHNYNWWDAIHDSVSNPCGNNSQQPCDDYFHGSHTTGSAVGSDGGANQIGVAPGAKWIGCRNMDQGNGTPARYTECFQFMIAPTDLAGQNPNPSLRPHVIINSWGCPSSEGCTTGAELETIVNNTQASGIFVEVSAGNSGPGCSSVTDPPALYSAAFSTGAIDIGNNLAGFSSRGPSLYYTPNLLKPNVSAPGVNVRSATNSGDTNYSTASGTSMAGPHVVGVVALIWSARPSLVRDITATKELLQNTANPQVILNPVQTCGGIPSSQIPNNSFGYGRVDALAAYNASGGGTPTPTVPAPTATRTNTPIPPTATRTNTPQPPTATRTGTPIPPTLTNTPPAATPTRTNTPLPPTATNTEVAGATNTPVPPTATSTNTVVASTDTPVVPTLTVTPSQATNTVPVPSATATIGALPTGTPSPPSPPSATPTECILNFVDVHPGDWFYDYVKWMYCNNIITGYHTVPPCGQSGESCFKPNNSSTRAQISKMVVLGFNVPINTTGGPHFQDVPVGSTFYEFIETLYNKGAVNGYPCGGGPYPCIPPQNLPYFLPNVIVTRGQLTKILVLGASIPIITPPRARFEDDGVGSTFYSYVETLVQLGSIHGYPCGGPGEPCDVESRPYFRPGNNVTRAQLSQTIYLSQPPYPR